MAGFFNKIKNVIGIEEIDDDDDYYEDEKATRESSKDDKSMVQSPKPSYEPASTSDFYGKEINKRSNSTNMSNSSFDKTKINIHEPIEYDDCTTIVKDIKNKKVVVLNLELLELDKKKQLFDFISGAMYAIEGNMQKVTKDIFVLAPHDVAIDGKLKEQIQSKGFYQI